MNSSEKSSPKLCQEKRRMAVASTTATRKKVLYLIKVTIRVLSWEPEDCLNCPAISNFLFMCLERFRYFTFAYYPI